MADPRGRARRGGLLAGLALTLVPLAACGGEADISGYCDAFLERRQELTDLAARTDDGGPVDVLTPTLTAFEALREEAPEELRDEWDTLVFAYRDLAEAVDEAGVDPAGFRPGEVPEGLAPEDRRRLARVAGALGSARVTEAAEGVEGYARQVCEGEPSDEES